MRGAADLHENQLCVEKRCFRLFLVISGRSRPQKWIQLEISSRMVSGGLEVKIKVISSQIYDFVYKPDMQPRGPFTTPPPLLVNEFTTV